MKSRLFAITLSLLVMLMIFSADDLFAQGCVQCRMAPESNLQGGGSVAKNLNTGILYMMAVPYVLIMALGIYAFRKRIKTELVKRGILKVG
jgi:hypothetical protein